LRETAATLPPKPTNRTRRAPLRPAGDYEIKLRLGAVFANIIISSVLFLHDKVNDPVAVIETAIVCVATGTQAPSSSNLTVG
jgi:hypothetical protein